MNGVKEVNFRLIVKQLIIITFVFLTNFCFGQKFMIRNNDTLPYKREVKVSNGDTFYLEPCWTFEKVYGQIINQQDKNCVRQGQWIITDSLGNYWEGKYKNNKSVGVWKQFNNKGELLKEKEIVSINQDIYKVKEIEYSNGKAVIIVDKPFLAFYLKNLLTIIVILSITFFGRLFINSRIYNIENETNYSPIYFNFGSFTTNNYSHSLLCTFSFWFSNYKPVNRKLVLITNTLSIISLGLFFGIIIALVITEEI